ncbi:MAG: glycosyltransferase [Pseudomonadota bacterium]|nr:glycosyltransferase [Pseudomonadota bacterium]
MNLSVIIPHFNQPELLALCLGSLRAQPGAERMELIVVDNGSRVLPEEVVAAFPGVTLLQEREPGPGPARNLGAAHAAAPLLAFIDADIQVAEDWLDNVLATFEDPSVMIAGGQVRILFRDPGAPTPIEAYESVYAFRQQDYIERQGFSGAGAMCVRREVFARVGPFGGIGSAEDRDWGLRAGGMGIRTIYAPRIVVFHPARPSIREMKAKWSRMTAHAFRDQARGLGGRARWWLKALAMPVSPLAEIGRIRRDPALTTPAARLGAFRILCAIRLHRGLRMAQLALSPRARGDDADWSR